MLGPYLFLMIASAVNPLPLKTVNDRVAEYGAVVRERLEPHFRAAGIPYPPEHLTLVAFKQERVLEVYAAGAADEFRFICSYPVLGGSGLLGPKLREGDRQVPEGLYRIRELNPNSLFHLSLWIDYPNEFDLARAAEEDRTDPGSEIMIHGGTESRGCQAVGDPASEDLFVLAALTGIENIIVILAPVDLREKPGPNLPNDSPVWSGELYHQIGNELLRYQKDPHLD